MGGRRKEKRQCLCDRMCLGSSVGVSALGHTIKEGQSQGYIPKTSLTLCFFILDDSGPSVDTSFDIE